MASGNIRYPFGAADVQSITGSGAQAITVDDLLTILELSALTGGVTINLTFESTPPVPVGARMIIHAVQGGTGQNVTLGTGFDAAAADLTGVANDEDIIELYYNGTAMVPFSDWIKIVDAA